MSHRLERVRLSDVDLEDTHGIGETVEVSK